MVCFHVQGTTGPCNALLRIISVTRPAHAPTTSYHQVRITNHTIINKYKALPSLLIFLTGSFSNQTFFWLSGQLNLLKSALYWTVLLCQYPFILSDTLPAESFFICRNGFYGLSWVLYEKWENFEDIYFEKLKENATKFFMIFFP